MHEQTPPDDDKLTAAEWDELMAEVVKLRADNASDLECQQAMKECADAWKAERDEAVKAVAALSARCTALEEIIGNVDGSTGAGSELSTAIALLRSETGGEENYSAADRRIHDALAQGVDVARHLAVSQARCTALEQERDQQQTLADERAELMTQLAELSNTYLARCQHLEQAVRSEVLRELLAALAHEQWAGWMRHQFTKCPKDAQGQRTIPTEWVTRWQRQIDLPYADLREDERESDRKEADRMLAALASLLPSQDETPRMDENRVSFAAGYSTALDDVLKGTK